MQQQGKFILFTPSEFGQWLTGLKLVRKIKLVQNHHTWLPDYATFYKVKDHFKLLLSMERAHIERGFAEIAQNLTTFPDGKVAVCRSLETMPAGIKGANQFGICIEHVGNFDVGKDAMTAAHRSTIIKVNSLLCKKFGLAPSTDTVVYHHWYDLTTGKRVKDGSPNTKTCPGTAFFGGNTIEACKKNFIPLL
jgi:N-acetylmuramoyl-L-alanine amidase